MSDAVPCPETFSSGGFNSPPKSSVLDVSSPHQSLRFWTFHLPTKVFGSGCFISPTKVSGSGRFIFPPKSSVLDVSSPPPKSSVLNLSSPHQSLRSEPFISPPKSSVLDISSPHQSLRFWTFHLPTKVSGSGRFISPPKVFGSGRFIFPPKSWFWTGAPCSHQRTWAENGFFKCFHFTRNDCDSWAIVFPSRRRISGRGCAPSYSAHVRWGEHGAPSRTKDLSEGVKSDDPQPTGESVLR